MTSSLSPSSILVDVELPDPEPLSPGLIDLLSSLHVVLLGWYAVPEQTSPEQGRDQFGADARDTLKEVARRFQAAGAEVTTRLVFTGNELETITRISAEEDCDAVLIPGPIENLRRILVPLRGTANAHRIAPFVADLCRSRADSVTLLHVLEDGEAATTSREDVLDPVAKQMTDHGLEPDVIQFETVPSDDPAETILDTSSDHDLVVLGETDPSVREILFGTVPERVVKATRVPVIVIRHEGLDIQSAERATRTERSS